MASKAQRAVTGVPPERWTQLGKALQEWREDELGYQVRGRFAQDRHVNIRLIQDLEKNYRPGTYTKWALADAARAYEITYESLLAFLHGEADTFTRAGAGAAEKRPAVIEVPGPPPSPYGPAREAAVRPYFMPIWDRFLELPRRVTEPSGTQMFPDDPDDARAWDGIGARLEIGYRMWFIAELRANADRRDPGPGAGSGTASA